VVSYEQVLMKEVGEPASLVNFEDYLSGYMTIEVSHCWW
jgi:hypothetical protein